ncbi:hypothetical protein REPUB_Repub03eG0218500 [Reevesia pubescens]
MVRIIVAYMLTAKDGINTPPKDYSIHNESPNIIFTTIGASASLVFAFNTVMLLELQATVMKPIVWNMLKTLYFQFIVGVLSMYDVTFIGYWAFGASTSTYLLNSVSNPVWVKATTNIFVFLQLVIALHFLPIYLTREYAMRACYVLFKDDGTIKLPYVLAIN